MAILTDEVKKYSRADLEKYYCWAMESLDAFRSKFGVESNCQALDAIADLQAKLAAKDAAVQAAQVEMRLVHAEIVHAAILDNEDLYTDNVLQRIWGQIIESKPLSTNDTALKLLIAEAVAEIHKKDANEIAKQRDAFCAEHGQVDPETGVWEATIAQEQHAISLEEMEEVIRKLEDAANAEVSRLKKDMGQ